MYSELGKGVGGGREASEACTASVRNLHPSDPAAGGRLRNPSEGQKLAARIHLAEGSAMDFSLAGFRMSMQEWTELDERARLQLLQIFIETSPPRSDNGVYETYELTLEPVYVA